MNLDELTDERIDVLDPAGLNLAYRDAMGWTADSRASPASYMRDSHEMESRLAEMGLAERYVRAIASIVAPRDRGLLYPESRFAFAHASPRDRCRAALRAVRDSKREQAE